MTGFHNISYLSALTIIPFLFGLYFMVIVWKKRTLKKIGDENLVQELTRNYAPRKFALKFVFVLVAIVCIILALANLRTSTGTEKVNRSGIDVMIALDVSKSMLAQDIKPNRLERAKQTLSKLIDELNNNRVGIVIFAGRAYLQMPLTADHSAAKMYLASATTEMVPTQGTVIADALKMCRSAFNTKEKKYKAVILISDGEDHDEGALNMASDMAAEGIIIHTIGIGSSQGATIMDELTNQEKKDEHGNTIVTRLNEVELKEIAVKGRGEYQLFDNSEDLLQKLQYLLGSMDRRAVTDDTMVHYQYFFPYFLLLAFLLLIIEILLSERKKWPSISGIRKIKPVKVIVIVFIISVFPDCVIAQTDKMLIQKGNEAYEKKDYDLAIKKYSESILKNTDNTTARHNLGNALYRNKKTDEAIQAYDEALTKSVSKSEKSTLYYNKGVVYQNNKKLADCIEAYKQALKLNPEDEDARLNLQKALQEQQQREKKEGEDKKSKDDNKEKEKPKDEGPKNQPKPKPSMISKEDAEEKLKALLQQEKNLQGKMRSVNAASLAKPEKDW